MSFMLGTSFGFHPFQFSYPPRKLTMEEMFYKFIDEVRREHEEMGAFVREFKTTNELLLKERNNSLSELEFELYGLSKAINDAQSSNYEVKGLGEPKPTRMSLELADRSIQYPRGIAENVLIKIDKFILPIDFVILDMREDSKILIILGRSFLATARAMIDVFNKKITLRVGNEEMLERLSGNKYHCFLDGFSGFFQIPIAPEDQEKTTFTCPYGTFAYRRMPFGLCNAPATFQRCMTAIFHDMVEDFMEVFMDDFLVFGNSFDQCLNNLDKMLGRCEEINLVLNWEKCNFMVKEGIVLGHKISGKGIEVDKAKIDVIAKLPYPSNVKGVRSFLGHAWFYRSTQDAKPRLIKWVLLLQGFNIEIKDKKGAKNLAADHLSRLENPNMGELSKYEITDKFLDEHLMILKAKLNDEEPWCADYINYIVGKVVPPKRCMDENKILEILAHCHSGPTGGHHSASVTGRKVYEAGSYWPNIFKDAKDYIEHKAYWALKQCNMDLTTVVKNHFMELNELMELRDGSYENTRIYKERTKRWHDSRLRGDKNFINGDKILLFNSLWKLHPGKIKSKWSGPFVVKTVYPYGAVEITDNNGLSFKVKGQRLKKYYDRSFNTEDNEIIELDE
ncbi:reverse transcriptase domain-containing protein [Tanacetum coccineum]